MSEELKKMAKEFILFASMAEGEKKDEKLLLVHEGFRIEKRDPFPPGNPFLHDTFHTGFNVGNGMTIMNNNEKGYIIICNVRTGKRIYISMEGWE